jgi:hypothetical protein
VKCGAEDDRITVTMTEEELNSNREHRETGRLILKENLEVKEVCA